MIIAATGHRPDKLGGYDIKTRRALGALAVEYLHERRPDEVIVGMAQGWDQAVAAACVVLDIPFVAAIPFFGQEQRWPEEAQQRYFRLLGMAKREVYTSEDPSYDALQRRNEWMVGHAGEMAALWNGTTGGTFNCLKYADRKGVPVVNLWPRWTLPFETREMIFGGAG